MELREFLRVRFTTSSSRLELIYGTARRGRHSAKNDNVILGENKNTGWRLRSWCHAVVAVLPLLLLLLNDVALYFVVTGIKCAVDCGWVELGTDRGWGLTCRRSQNFRTFVIMATMGRRRTTAKTVLLVVFKILIPIDLGGRRMWKARHDVLGNGWMGARLVGGCEERDEYYIVSKKGGATVSFND